MMKNGSTTHAAASMARHLYIRAPCAFTKEPEVRAHLTFVKEVPPSPGRFYSLVSSFDRNWKCAFYNVLNRSKELEPDDTKPVKLQEEEEKDLDLDAERWDCVNI